MHVDVDGDSDSLRNESIQPVGLIVNELVTNAAKHGAGPITVMYKSRDATAKSSFAIRARDCPMVLTQRAICAALV